MNNKAKDLILDYIKKLERDPSYNILFELLFKTTIKFKRSDVSKNQTIHIL